MPVVSRGSAKLAYDVTGSGSCSSCTPGSPTPAAGDHCDALAVLDAAPIERATRVGASRGNRLEAHAWLDGWSAREGRVQGWTRHLFLAMNGLHIRLADQAGPEIAGVPDVWQRVTTIAVPTLVLVGALDDTEIAASQHLGATIPGARLEILDGTGHLPHLEGHGRCLDLIAEFLSR